MRVIDCQSCIRFHDPVAEAFPFTDILFDNGLSDLSASDRWEQKNSESEETGNE